MDTIKKEENQAMQLFKMLVDTRFTAYARQPWMSKKLYDYVTRRRG